MQPTTIHNGTNRHAYLYTKQKKIIHIFGLICFSFNLTIAHCFAVFNGVALC